MLAIDTNILVRLFVDDDSSQHHTVKEFFKGIGESEQVFVSLIVITELVWVLESGYGYKRGEISEIIAILLEVEQISFQNSIALYFALQLYKKGADFADSLITALANDAGCTRTMTFDKKAVRNAGMTLLENDAV